MAPDHGSQGINRIKGGNSPKQRERRRASNNHANGDKTNDEGEFKLFEKFRHLREEGSAFDFLGGRAP